VTDEDLQSSTCGYTVFPVLFVDESAFSAMDVFGTFVENKMTVTVWIPFLDLSYFNMSVLVPVPCCFCYYDLIVFPNQVLVYLKH
jgi:hypothetical protein